jgi:hypothetical protein
MAHHVDLGVRHLLEGADELMHATLAYRATALLHHPE